jgi:hypothetical protein
MGYSLAEHKLRQILKDQNQTVRDQRMQPTTEPTFQYIAQKFQGIHWINHLANTEEGYINAVKNLSTEL